MKKNIFFVVILFTFNILAAVKLDFGEGIFFNVSEEVFFSKDKVLEAVKKDPFNLPRQIYIVKRYLETIDTSNKPLDEVSKEKKDFIASLFQIADPQWSTFYVTLAYAITWNASRDTYEFDTVSKLLYANNLCKIAEQLGPKNEMIALFSVIIRSAIVTFSKKLLKFDLNSQIDYLLSFPSIDPAYYYLLAQLLTGIGENFDVRKTIYALFDKSLSLMDDEKLKLELMKRILNIYSKMSENFKDIPIDLKLNIYQLATKVYPDDPNAYNNLAYFYAQYATSKDKKLLNKALEEVDKALNLVKDDKVKAAILDTKAYILMKLKKLDEAEKILLEAYKLNPTLEDTLNHLVELYYVEKKDANTLKYLEQLVNLTGKDLYKNNLAYTLAVLNKELKRALKLAEEVYKNNPTNETYLDTYGWCLYKNNKVEEAEKVLKQALEICKKKLRNCWEIEDHLGEIYIYLGKYKEALEIYKKIVNEYFNLPAHVLKKYAYLETLVLLNINNRTKETPEKFFPVKFLRNLIKEVKNGG